VLHAGLSKQKLRVVNEVVIKSVHR